MVLMSNLSYKNIAIWGFLFGAVGLPLLGGLALLHPIFELVAYPFVIPTKFLASILGLQRAGTLVSLVVSGVFYAALGLSCLRLYRSIQKPTHLKSK
jgi:hypothetical protein